MHNGLALAPGSLGALAQRDGLSLAESFLNVDGIIIVDVSSSMQDQDAPGGKSRYAAALEELAALQANLPGKVAVIAFSNMPQFVPGGLPPMSGGTTNLAQALRFAQAADGVPGMRFVVISDGQPDNEDEALKVATCFKNRIDTIFVGSELHPVGRDFLRRLAERSGGRQAIADRTYQLSAKVQQMLLTA